MKNFTIESEISAIFAEAQEKLFDSDLRKLDIGTICGSIGISRHAFYDVKDSEVMPSKDTIEKVACAFQLSGDQLIRLANLNGYIYPFSFRDRLVHSFFEKGEVNEFEIDEALISAGYKPLFSSSRTR